MICRECNECNSIVDCGYCFMDDPANGGVSKGSCLLSKENSTFLSDYGPCSNLSSSVISIPFVFFPPISDAYFPIIPESTDRESDIDLCLVGLGVFFLVSGIYAGWA